MRSWVLVWRGMWDYALVLIVLLLSTTQSVIAQSRQQATALAAPSQQKVPATSTSSASPSNPNSEASQLKIQLIGTMVGLTSADAVAILEDEETHKRQFYRLGEMIQGYRLVTIGRWHVGLEAHGRQQLLEFNGDSSSEYQSPAVLSDTDPCGAAASTWQQRDNTASTMKSAMQLVSRTERVVNREVFLDVMQRNPDELMCEGNVQQAIVSDELMGIQLTWIPADGILSQSGFQSGDIIRSVNGQPATDSSSLLQLPINISQSNVMEVQVERYGQPLTLTYQIQ